MLPARTPIGSLSSDPSLEKQLELLQAEHAALKEFLERHADTMNQRVGSLPSAFQAVHNNIQKCTSQQDTVFEAVKKLEAGQLTTEKNVGHVQHLVSDLWKNNKQSVRLADDKRTLETALQEVHQERRASQSQLADSEEKVQELLEEKHQLQLQVERLLAENKAFRDQQRSQKIAEPLPSQAKPRLMDLLAPQFGPYSDLVEASRNPNWVHQLGQPKPHRR